MNRNTDTIPEQQLPRDEFTTTRRDLMNHPETITTVRTITRTDWYGNTELWHVELLRVDGHTTALLHVHGADRAVRLVLPPTVMDALLAGQAATITKVARRAARKAVETKRAKGQTIGNVAALAKGRATRRHKTGGR